MGGFSGSLGYDFCTRPPCDCGVPKSHTAKDGTLLYCKYDTWYEFSAKMEVMGGGQIIMITNTPDFINRRNRNGR